MMIQAVKKAVGILNAVAAAGDWVGVRDIARAAGLNPSTTQNLLKTMQAVHYLEFNEDTRRYKIGVGILTLMHGINSVRLLGEFARPYVQEIFDAYGETTTAICYDNGKFIASCSMRCTKNLGTDVALTMGVIRDFHLMAAGEAFFAWLHEYEIDAYCKTHVDTLAGGRESLEETLRHVRKAGYSKRINVRGSNIAAYGVPVFDGAGRIVLSLGWSVPLVRFTPELEASALKKLLEVSQAMTAALNLKSIQSSTNSKHEGETK